MTLLRSRTVHGLLLVLALGAIGPRTFGQTLPGGNPLRETEGKPVAVRPSAEGPADAQVPRDDLASRTARLADRFDRLEMLAGRLAELSRSTQPHRAKLLRELISQSHDRDIAGRFQSIVDALDGHALSSAHGRQLELQTQLRNLLELLLREDREQRIESQRKRVRKYLSDIKRLVRLQRGVKARTEGGDTTKPLSIEQQRIAQGAAKLRQSIADQEGLVEGSKLSGQKTPPSEGLPKNAQGGEHRARGDSVPSPQSRDKPPAGNHGEHGASGKGEPGEAGQGKPSSGESPRAEASPGGQPSDGEPSDGKARTPKETPPPPSSSPMRRAQKKIEKAQRKMRAASKKLEEAQRAGAVERQESALRELEQAKAELERILRQLREEELERTLVMLEARFRKMLEMQVKVHEETVRLASRKTAVPGASTGVHEVEIAGGRLSRKERQIVLEADRALILLREDGSSVAFPETLDQAREDMRTVADRLGEIRLGTLTQGLEEDIIAALEESLAALRQALKEIRDSQGKPQPGSGSEEQSLVDQLAELRMIRSLQQRVNRRTDRYGKLLAGEQANEEEILAALKQLALREERIYQATHDLHTKKNQ